MTIPNVGPQESYKDDLIKRLRTLRRGDMDTFEVTSEAADRIAELEAENAQLREAVIELMRQGGAEVEGVAEPIPPEGSKP